MSLFTLRTKVAIALVLPGLLLALVAPAAGADLKTTASSISFISVVGTSPEPQQFAAYAIPATAGFAPSVLASSQGGSWLSVSAGAGGSFPSSRSILVSVNSSALAVGTYTGQITITQSGLTGSPASLPVSLRVIPPAPYLASNPESLNVAARVGVDPAPLSLFVNNAGTGSLSPTFSASSSGNWLLLSQPSGGSFQSSNSVIVIIRSSGLAAGTYNGTITVTAAGASNSPLNVPVNLTVGNVGGPVISASTASLTFTAGLGANPRQRSIAINNSGSGTLRPTVTSSTVDGGRWLLVNASSAGSFATTTTITVDININGLAKGTYTGTITITDASAANSPVQIPVTLVVDDPKPVMALSNRSFVWGTPVGNFEITKFVDVFNNGTGRLRWTAVARSEGPVRWLSVTPDSGEAVVDSYVYVTANTTGLPQGIYRGEVEFTALNATSGDAVQKVQVTLAIGVPLPAVNSNGLVNGATFSASAVAAGEIVSVFGRELGPRQSVLGRLVAGKLQTEVAGVRVLFDGVAAPLFYVSDTQLNVQVPMEMAGKSTVYAQVFVNGVPGEEVRLAMRSADPGVFQVSGRPAIFFNSSGEQVSDNVPARAGDYLTIYATGLGPLDTALETGAVAPSGSVLIRTRSAPRVTLGGVVAPVVFSGLAPGFVGLYQVNIQVPAGVVSGTQSLILSVDGAETAPMNLAVR